MEVEGLVLLADREHGVGDDVRELVRHLLEELRPERRAGDGGEELLVDLAVGPDGALLEFLEEDEGGLLRDVEALGREGREELVRRGNLTGDGCGNTAVDRPLSERGLKELS